MMSMVLVCCHSHIALTLENVVYEKCHCILFLTLMPETKQVPLEEMQKKLGIK